MNKGNVSTLPSETDPPKSSELVTELDRVRAEERVRLEELARLEERARAEEIFGLYHHTPAMLGITLREVVDVIKKRWLYLLIGLVLGIELAMLALALITPLYAVSAQVIITKQDPGQVVDMDSGSSAFIATQAEVMHSPRIVSAAVASLPHPTFLEQGDDPVAVALDSVRASAISGTRVIALGYLGADPDYGSALLNAMVGIYLDEVQDSTQSDQVNLLDIKNDELDDLQDRILQQETEVGSLREESSIVGTADEVTATQAALVDSNVQALADARNRRIELETRLAAGGAASIANDPVRLALEDRLREAESKLAVATVMLTAEHPTYLGAKRNVEVLRAQLASSAGGSLSALRRQIDEARRLETELSGIEKQSRGRLEEIEIHRREENKLLLGLTRMQSQADQWQRDLLEQRVVTRLARTGDVGIDARMIEEPTVPEKAVWPKKKLMLAAGGALGLLLAFGFGLFSLRRQRNEEVVEW